MSTSTPALLYEAGEVQTQAAEWRKCYPRFNANNLETEGVLKVPNCPFVFVQKDHPVINLLSVNKELVGFDVASLPLMDNQCVLCPHADMCPHVDMCPHAGTRFNAGTRFIAGTRCASLPVYSQIRPIRYLGISYETVVHGMPDADMCPHTIGTTRSPMSLCVRPVTPCASAS